MGVRGVLRPVGPQPVGVYWWRRVLLALGLLVLLLVGKAVLGGDSPSAAAGGTGGTGGQKTTGGTTHHQTVQHQTKHRTTRHTASSPTTTHAKRGAARSSPAAGSASPATPPPACGAADVSLEISTDHTSYAGGQEPRFLLTVGNASHHACRADLGTAARSFLVRSGADRIWSSADCGTAGHTVVTLRPGRKLAYAATWSRQRSAPGCPSDPADALPGTYRVTGHLGGLSTGEAVFVLSD